MAESILVPVDGSDESIKALEYAVEEYSDTDLTVLSVVNPGEAYDIEIVVDAHPRSDPPETANERAKAALERAKEIAPDAETVRARGPVSQTIVTYAEDESTDLIVIGSRGRGGASRVLLGSVAETVARRAPCPVLIVR